MADTKSTSDTKPKRLLVEQKADVIPSAMQAETLAVLKSIDASLKTIVAAIQKPQSIHVGR